MYERRIMNERRTPHVSFSQNRRVLNRTRVTGICFLILSAIAIAASYVYSSSVLTVIGLGLTIWGILVLYIQTDEYVKRTLMDAVTEASFKTIVEMISKLDYQGKAWYLSPVYAKDSEASKVYIAKRGNVLPRPEAIRAAEDLKILQNQEGLLIDAPGAGLNKLFEKALGESFSRVDFAYLERKLPTILVEDFEIAQECRLAKNGDRVVVTLNNCIIMAASTVEKTDQASEHSGLGSPIASAIACALAKSTGISVSIASERQTGNSKDVEIQYELSHMEKSE